MAVLNRSMEFKVPRDREKSTTLEAGAGERAPQSTAMQGRWREEILKGRLELAVLRTHVCACAQAEAHACIPSCRLLV